MERVHPGDRRAVGERIAWPRPGDLSFRVPMEDGALRFLRGSLEPSPAQGGRVTGYVQDLTELARTQADLKESEERYRELSMAATEGIVIHDGGTIVDVNNAFCRLMGGYETDLTGKNLLELAHPDDVSLLAARLESERDRSERFRLRTLAGDTVVVEITSRSAPRHGRIVRMSAVRDITAAIRAEERAEGQRRLLAQTDRLRSLGTLVAGVAHEINNPNSFVMFNAPLIERAWRDAISLLDEVEREKGPFTLAGMPYARVRGDVPTFIENILSGARRIQEIVEKLRTFVGGAGPGEMELVDPVKVVEEAVELLAPLVARTRGTVTLRSVGRILPIRGRAAEIGQVVVNLVANALQALPEKGGQVTVKTVGEAALGTVAIVVEDDGAGIAPEELEKIFDPFYTTRRGAGGSGLGLSISHTIVEDHGGRLTIEPLPGAGTRATARFPVAAGPDR
ncbi:MAG: PAS domain S-box protein [Nitrospinae bacterium]|nr:PAS domain S-box protein [Nitrospinota bacterium]